MGRISNRSEDCRRMTSLPLFDRVAEPAGQELESVSELTARIRSSLERDFAEVAIRAEVSNLSRPRSGHVYLSLKDESAQIRAVLWKSEARRLVFDLTDGLAVRVWGRLTVYPLRGDYQVVDRRDRARGDRRAGAGLPPDGGAARGRGAVRPGAQASPAPLPEADRGRDQPHRRRGPRPAAGPRPALAGGRHPDRADAGAGPRRRRADRRRASRWPIASRGPTW